MQDKEYKINDTDTQEVEVEKDATSIEHELPVEEDATDNVSDESFETGDNTSQLADDAADWRDKYMRLSAEFDNYRKRTLKERIDLISNAGEDVVKAVLPVVDDLDRAVDAVEKSDDIESARTGIKLIQQKLIDILRHKGLGEIEAKGSELDTDYHEAVAKFAAGDEHKGKIIDVVQKGYKLKDKVIRFAKVVVGE